MEGVGSILVVDRSETARQVLSTLLVPHCDRVVTTETASEAIDAIESDASIGLVLCDALLPDRTAFDVLRSALERAGNGAKVVLISPWWIPTDAARAEKEGALGYLVRPISLRDVARLWKQEQAPLLKFLDRTERRPLAKVWLLDPTEQVRYVLSWDLYDISTSGAFIETRGPLTVGTELHLEIILGKQVVRALCLAVRVQEPCWMHVGGVGVRFLSMSNESRRLVDAFVHQSSVLIKD